MRVTSARAGLLLPRFLIALLAGLLTVSLAAVPAQAAGEDTLPPVITFTPELSTGWYSNPVTFNVKATDNRTNDTGINRAAYELNGHTTTSVPVPIPPGSGANITISAKGATTVNVEAFDNWGHRTFVSSSVRVDLDDPVAGVSLSAPSPYRPGQTVIASYSCSDPGQDTGAGTDITGSGVASCAGNVPTGAPIDTSTVGSHTFTVTATDKAGRTGTRVVQYDVVAPNTMEVVTPPTMTGAVKVGATVTGTPTVTRPAATRTDCTWAALLTGNVGTGSQFTIPASLLGDTLSYNCTSVLGGYDDLRRQSSSATIQKGDLADSLVTNRNLAGTSAAGATLTASYTLVGAPANTTADFVWLRDGTAIADASGSTYVIKPSDLGHVIRAEVRLRNPAYNERSYLLGERDLNDTVGPAIVVSPAPTDDWRGGPITYTLTATENRPLDTSVVEFRYQLTGSTGGSGNLDPATGGTISVTAGGGTHVSLFAKDAKGNTTTREFDVRIDRGDPTIDITSPVDNHTYEVGDELIANYTCDDELSGIVSCDAPLLNGEAADTSTPGNYTFTVVAGDRAGRETTRTVSFRIVGQLGVTALPEVVGSGRVGEVLTGRAAVYNPAAAVACHWERNGTRITSDGVANYTPVPGDLNATLTYDCLGVLDGYANTTSRSNGRRVQPGDLPDGLVTDAALDGIGEVGQTLTASYTIVDYTGLEERFVWLRDGEVIAGATGSTYVLQPADLGHVVRATAEIRRDGYNTRRYPLGERSLKDERPPVITATPAPIDGWLQGSVTYRLKATDNQPKDSGVSLFGYELSGAFEDSADLDVNDGGDVTIDVEGITHVRATAIDVADNTGTLDFDVRIDRTDPSAEVTGLVEGAELALRQEVHVSFSCADSQSGIATCKGDVDSGAAIDTSTAGAHTFKVTATDLSGRTSTRTISYVVQPGPAELQILTPAEIAGSGRVGAELVGTPATFEPTAATSCRWLRDGAPITGANGATYTPVASDLGTTITFECTGVLGGYADRTSVSVGRIVVTGELPADLVTDGDLDGIGQVGRTLTAAYTIGDRPDDLEDEIVWLRDFDPIDGAAGPSYVVRPADLDHSVRAVLVVTRPGYDERRYPLGVVAVVAGADERAPIVTVDPEPTDGWLPDVTTFHLTARDDRAGDTGVATFDYELSGASESTGDLDPVEGGDVTVEAEGTTRVRASAVDGAGNVGRADFDVRLDLTDPELTVDGIGDDQIVGLGEEVRVSYACTDGLSGIASCDGTVPDGEPIDTSTAGRHTFRVTATDHAGRTTTYGIGYRVYPRMQRLTPIHVVGSGRVGEELVGTPPTYDPEALADCYWFRDGFGFLSGDVYTPVPSDIGSNLSYGCYSARDGYVEEVDSSAAIAVEPGHLPDDLVTDAALDGRRRVGSTLTASYSIVHRPADLEEHVVWIRDGVRIDVTGASYTLREEDLGRTVSAAVEVSRPGYDSRRYPLGSVVVRPESPDQLAPELTVTPGPFAGWLREATTYHLKATDDRPLDTGVVGFTYRLSGASVAAGDLDLVEGGDITVDAEGITRVRAKAIDDADNAENADFDVRIDLTDPEVAVNGIWDGVVVEIGDRWPTGIVCADDQSGIGSCVSDAKEFEWLDTDTVGTHTLTATATDKSGRTTSRTVTYKVRGWLDVVSAPSVEGSGKVGQELVGSPAVFEPNVEVACHWERDGSRIDGADAATYVPVGADLGASLVYNCETRSDDYFDSNVMSQPVEVVAGDLPDGLITDRDLDGTAEVGTTLTASYTIADRPDDLEAEVLWLRDGELIDGATGTTYVVTGSDPGHTIRAVLDVTRPGYADRRYPIGLRKLFDDDAPIVAADPEPTSDWQPDAVTYHLSATDDRPYDLGVTSFAYELSGASQGSGDLDVAEGGNITVSGEGVTRVRATATDGAEKTGVLEFEARVDLTDPSVTVSGLADGAELRLGEEVHVSYACTDDLSGIDRCDGDVPDGDAVDTTARGDHLFSVMAIDNAGRVFIHDIEYTVVGDEPLLRILTRAGLSGSGRVGSELTGAPATFEPEAATTCRWLRDGDPIEGADGATYTPVADDLGSTITFECVGVLDEYADTTSTSVGRIVVEGDLPDDLVTDRDLAGTGEVGTTLTASYTIVNRPDDLETEIVWLRDGEPIDGVTGPTYVVPGDDFGHTLRAVLDVSRPGYADRRYLIGERNLFDADAPQIAVTPEPTDRWHRAAATYHLSATDDRPYDLGVIAFGYQLSGATERSGALDIVHGGDLTIGAEGVTRLRASATDGADQTADREFDVRVDLTDPEVTLEGIEPNTWLYLGSEVPIDYSCTDDQSGIDSCDADGVADGLLDTSTPGEHTLRVEATDNSGRTTVTSMAYVVYGGSLEEVVRSAITGSGRVGDELTGTPPTFAPEASGVSCWWVRDGQRVTARNDRRYTPTAADLDATLMYDCVGTRDYYNDQWSTSDPVTVTVGELGDDAATGLSLDGIGQVGTSLAASYTIADRSSGLTDEVVWLRDFDPIDGATGATYVVRPDDLDHAVRAVLVLNRPGYAERRYPIGQVDVFLPADELAPVVSVAPEPSEGWLRDAVTYRLTARDDRALDTGVRAFGYVLSGSSVGSGDLDVVEGGDVTVSSEGVTRVHATATDGAGNAGEADFEVRVDLTDPELTVNGVVEDAEYLVDRVVDVDVACADDQSGIETCESDLLDGGVLDTSTVGVRSVTATATDNSGRTTTRVVRYRVVAEDPQLQVAVPAEIVGSGAVGAELVGHAAVFAPAALATCVWLRDGVAVTGDGVDRYTPTAADLGSTITFECVGVLEGYADATSASVGRIVVEGDLADDLVTDGAVAGDGVVGSTLTASYTIADRPADLDAEIVWLRDGSVIDGATGTTYVVVAADAGHTVRAVLDVTRPGYAGRRYPLGSVEVIDVSADVLAPVVSVAPEPSDAWLRDAATYRLAARDDRALDTGVTGFGYVLSGASVGSGDLDVVEGGDVTVSSEGVTRVHATATDRAGNAGTADFEVRLDLTDPELTVGGVTDGMVFDLDEVVALDIACVDDQSGIESCDSDSEDFDRLDTDVAGDQTLTATATDNSGRTTARTVSYTVRDRLHVMTESGLSGSGRVGVELSGVPAVFDPTAVVTCGWLRDGDPIEGAEGATYMPTAEDLGSTITFECVGVLAGYADATSTSVGRIVVAGDLADDLVTGGAVAGDGVVGSTLTASYTIANRPADLDAAVRWLRDGSVIDGATGTTYVVVEADAGHTVRAVLDVTRPGYADRRYPLGSVEVAEVSADVLAPVVSVAPEPSEGWLRDVVTYRLTARDDRADDTGVRAFGYVLSGASVGSGDLDVVEGGDVAVAAEGVTRVRATATDGAGNAGEADFEVRVDLTDPELTVNGVAEDAEYLLDQVVDVDVACADEQSGIDTCESDLLDGGVLDTTTAGAHSVTATATDISGRTTTRVVRYRVVEENPQLQVAVRAEIVGSGAVGAELVGHAAVFAPDALATCVWLRNGVAITEVGVERYIPTAADLGSTITFECVGVLAGYADATSTSVGRVVVEGDLADGLVTEGDLTGDGVVGSTLTASYTIADRPADLDAVIVWLRDGSVIDGATGTTYVVVEADAGHTVRAVLDVTRPGYADRRYPLGSVEVAEVTGELQVVTESGLTGSGRVGVELTGTPAVFDPEAEVTCSWLRDGDPIEGAAGATYVPTAADLGSTIAFECVGVLEGYADATSTSVGRVVVAGDLPDGLVTEGDLTGDGVVGSTLTASYTITNRPDDLDAVIVWLRDGEVIDGATGTTYTVVAADAGHTVRAVLDVTRPGYTDRRYPLGSVDVERVLADDLVVDGGLAGEGRVGATLTASYTITNRPDDLDENVVWLRDGSVIDGATGASYTVVAADAGHTVRAVLDVTRPGYTDRRYPLGSVEVAEVEGELQVVTESGLTGSGRVGVELSGTPAVFDPTAVVTCGWLRDGDPITGAEGATYTPTAEDLGSTITFECVGVLAGYADATSTSVGRIVVAGDLPDGLVTEGDLTGDGVVGSTLTASYSITDRPEDLDAVIVWLRDGSVIDGATGSTYVVVEADAGHTIRAVLDVTRPGYADRRYPLGSVEVAEVSADVLAPVVTVAPEPSDGWLRDAATYRLTARDDRADDTGVRAFGYVLSGASVGSGDLDVVEGGDVTVSSEGVTRVHATATDGAGNAGEADFEVRVDLTDPSAMVTGLVEGAELALGQEIHVAYACDDAQSGIESCESNLPDGGMLDTATAGGHTLTVTATDHSGRTTTRTVGYTVLEDTEPQLQVVTESGLTGSGRVGVELTGVPAVFDPTAEVTCSWLRGGDPIAGAEGATYVPTAADLGSTITFECVGVLDGYAERTSTSTGRIVVAGDLPDGLVTDRSLDGTGEVGTTLTASYTITDRPDDLDAVIVWLRDGAVIDGATGATYTVVEADAGHTVRAVLDVTRPGYTDRRYPIGERKLFDDLAPELTIAPEPSAGWLQDSVTYHVTATDGRPWDTGVVEFRYQLTGATEASGQLDRGDGEDVTIHAEGVTRFQVTAIDADGHSAEADFEVRIDRTNPAVTTLTGLVEGAELGLGQQVHVAYTCDDSQSGIVTCDGTVPSGDAVDTTTPGAHTFAVVATDRSGRTTTRQVGYTVAEDAQPRLQVLSAPEVTGQAVVGQELTGTPASFDPAAEATCRWLRGGDPIDGAGGTTYTPVADDLGATITFECVGVLDGYADKTSTSAGRVVVEGDLPDDLVADGRLDGEGVVGATLTASYTIPARPEDLTEVVRWTRDGEVIDGATGTTYVVQDADAGHRVRAVLDATRPGYTDRRYLIGQVDVAPAQAELQVVTASVISGSGRVGEELVGAPAAFEPAAATTCRWLRDGAPIATGTDRYTPVAADLGTTITFECVGVLDGFGDTTSVSEGRAVTVGQLGDGLVVGGALAGTGEVGSTLTASYTIPGRPADLTDAVVWLRDDVAIDGATGSTYVVRTADVGHTVRAVLAVTRPGYTDRRYPLGSVVGRKIAVRAEGTLGFTGLSVVGQRLTAAPPVVRPASGGAPVATTLQWLRDGVPIVGATGATYLVMPVDMKHRITLRMTSTGDPASYDALVAETAPGPAVVKAKPTVRVKAKVKKKRKVQLVLTVAAGELKPGGKVVVKRGKKVVARGKVRAGKLTLKLKPQPKGRLKLTVRYAGVKGVAKSTVVVKVKVR